MPSPPDSAFIRAARYAWRVPLLLWHVFVHLPLVLLLISLPKAIRLRRLRSGEPFDHWVMRTWQGGLMRVFGYRMRRVGTPLAGAALFVANHVSWLDIVALHSQRMVGFVAKREISRWPVVGRLATRGETIFHQRGDASSLGGVMDEMMARLRDDRQVAVFPEGRTRDGREVGPFHARIFLAAVQTGAPVQPVALRYGRGGDAQTLVAFTPRENFASNLIRLLGERGGVAEVHFLQPITDLDAEGRRSIAQIARSRIAEAMQLPPQ